MQCYIMLCYYVLILPKPVQVLTVEPNCCLNPNTRVPHLGASKLFLWTEDSWGDTRTNTADIVEI